MRRTLALAVLLVSAGCATSITAARTKPDLETTGRAVARPATRSVLVLSPSALADVGVPAPGQPAPFVAPTAALERALFEASWNPVAKPALSRLVTTHKVALALRDVSGRDGYRLVDAAGTLGPASTADVVLLVNEWKLAWRPVPNARTPLAQLCSLTGELDVSLLDRAGAFLWGGKATGRSTDLFDLTMVDRSGRAELAELSHPQYACASRDASCGDCPQALDPEAVKTLAAHAAKTVVRDLGVR
jgi:hypothetical protein